LAGALFGQLDSDGSGESFLSVHWVAVPKALRARRVNRRPGRGGVRVRSPPRTRYHSRADCCSASFFPRAAQRGRSLTQTHNPARRYMCSKYGLSEEASEALFKMLAGDREVVGRRDLATFLWPEDPSKAVGSGQQPARAEAAHPAGGTLEGIRPEVLLGGGDTLSPPALGR
jgi:hypothetical protein